MEQSVWGAIIQEGFSPMIMAIFCYFTYRYFTKQNDKLYDRIAQKDDIILKLYSQHIEMTQMFVQTQLQLSNEMKDGIKIVMDIEEKIDAMSKQIKEIRLLTPPQK